MNKDIQRISSTPDEDTLFEQVSALIDIRQFYLTYSKRINSVYPIQVQKDNQ
jgi:hypothetical protein